MAELTQDATNEDYNKDKSDLIYNVKNAYWSLFKAIEMKKVLDENVDQIKAHLKDAQNLIQQGMLTNNDVLKIEVQLSDALFRQSDARNNVRLATIGLNNVLGISLNTQIEIKSTVELNGKDYSDLDGLVNKAFSLRPELKAADLRIKTSEAGISLAKSGWYPQVSVAGNYNYARPNQRIQPSKDQFDGTWDITLGLTFDIWNWNVTGHQTEQAEAQLSQTIDALGSIKDGVTLEVTQNFLNFQQAKEKISISELAVKQAEENLRNIGEKFKNGLALSSDVVDADVALLQAKTNNTTSIVDFELAKAKLVKAIGE
jgi:Outer membrane protein